VSDEVERHGWVEIPAETMRELRERGDRESAHRVQRSMFDSLPNGVLGNPGAMPVHFIDGKWYLEILPNNGRWSRHDIQEALRIERELELGDVEYDKRRNLMRIWQGEDGWLEVPGEVAHAHGITDEFKLTPAAIASLKEKLEEFEEEQERKQLRHLLSQQQGEDY
jgi:hypothetical protein